MYRHVQKVFSYSFDFELIVVLLEYNCLYLLVEQQGIEQLLSPQRFAIQLHS